MLATLPTTIEGTSGWTWDDMKPFYDEMLARDLSEATLDEWMRDWTNLNNVIGEMFTRAALANSQNTADEQAEAHYKFLMAEVYPPRAQAENQMNQKLVDSGLMPDNFEIPLKKLRTDIELFNEDNLPLATQEQSLGMEYSKITGGQTVEWDGEEITLVQLQKAFEDNDRDRREKAWRLGMERRLEDREAINNTWSQLFDLRAQMAINAGYDNYRDYAWLLRKRFDYTPEDANTFHNAIEEVVVPAALRANERRRERMGLDSLRPWDLSIDPLSTEPLRPWETIEDFASKAETIFNKVDPQLGEYYKILRDNDLLDLPNRKNKRPGAFCTRFPLQNVPFVFMNAVNVKGDVRTLLHEVGHAFHGFETRPLDYSLQRAYPIEFAEVASMAMELLAAPYLTKEHGGYYSEADAARDRVQHLEKILFFWPYMAVVDGFQHWAYTNGDAAKDPANCDAKWAELWDRFIKIDYSGLDDIKATGWHRKQHIFRFPFYYIEYGLAQLGAVQVWANALDNQSKAVADYRSGLALGGTRSLPELFGATGAKFAFDTETLGNAVELIEKTVNHYDNI